MRVQKSFSARFFSAVFICTVIMAISELSSGKETESLFWSFVFVGSSLGLLSCAEFKTYINND